MFSYLKPGSAFFLVLAVLLGLNVWAFFRVERLLSRGLTVSFLNIGQGDAIFIESPSGAQVLLDAGSGRAVLGQLSTVMDWSDRHLDVLIASHPDKDHIGGFLYVLERYSADLFVESGVIKDTIISKNLSELVLSHKLSDIVGKRGMTLDLGGGAFLEILYPDRDVSAVKDANDGSIVAKLSYLGHTFLLTGDATTKVESHLMALDSKGLVSEVLKVGHHGSKTSSSYPFLAAVSPIYSIVSLGAGNSYGHPHAEILERLGVVGTKIIRTDKFGRVIFKVQRGGALNMQTEKHPD